MIKNKWIKTERSEYDIKHNFGLCPVCKSTCETLTDGTYALAERCSRGCFVFKFDDPPE